MSIFYDKPLTPTSGKAEKEWFTLAKKSTGQAAISLGAISNVGKTVLNKAVVPTIKKAGTVIKDAYVNTFNKSPIITSGVSIAAAGYVAKNPKGAAEDISQIPSSTANFGGNVRTFRDEPTKENALNIAKENPVISGLVVGATGLIIGRGASYLYNTIPDNNKSSSIFGEAGDKAAAEGKKFVSSQDIPSIIDIPTYKPTKPEANNLPATITPQPANLLPSEVTQKSYTNSSGNKKLKAKRKQLNTIPITVRNTVNIFNKN